MTAPRIFSRWQHPDRSGAPAGLRPLYSFVAAITAAMLFLVIAPSPAQAVSAAEADNLQSLTRTAAPGFSAVSDSLPVVDSTAGRGDQLHTDPATLVSLGAAAEGNAAVLVRVTLLEPAVDTVVSTGADTAVLAVRAGTTGSSTVVLPLHSGAISLWGSANSPLRVEPLAYLNGGPAQPGATIALDTPVVRADTTAGFAGTALGTAPLWVGLTGEGDVSATQARSVYVTFDLTLNEADTVALSDGQQFTLPAGRSIVTTVVDAEQQGGVSVSLGKDGHSAQLRASVLAWVADVGEDAAKTNMTGSYVVSTEQRGIERAELRGGNLPNPRSSTIKVSDHEDVEYALALVATGGPTASPDTTTLAWGESVQGRASGVAVDHAAGAVPQLELVPTTGGSAQLHVRRGAVEATVQPLGGFLGQPVDFNRQDQPEIQITSPKSFAQIDLSEHGYFVLEGTAVSGSNAIDRIEISSPAVGFIGTADIDASGDTLKWSFRSLAPDDGEFDYVATLFDRSDSQRARASDRVKLTIETANEGDTVVSPDVKVFDASASGLSFRLIDERHLAFASKPDLEPGEIIVSSASPEVPEGYLARFSHMDLTDGVWVVETVSAAIEDVFFQADIDERIDYGEGDGVNVADKLATAANPIDVTSGSITPIHEDGTAGTEVPISEGEFGQPDETLGTSTDATFAELRQGEAVDLENSKDEFALGEADKFEQACRVPGSDGQEPTGATIDENGNWVPAGGTSPSGDTACGSDMLRASFDANWTVGLDAGFVVEGKNGKWKIKTAPKEATEDPWAFEGWSAEETTDKTALAIKAGGEVGVGFHFKLDVSVKWKWKVIPRGVTVNTFKVSIDYKLKANAAITAAFTSSQRANLKLDVADVGMPSITFFAGPVPVVISNRLNFAIAVTGEIKAEIKIPALGIERSDEAGFEYSSAEGLKRIKNDPKTKYVLPTFQTLKSKSSLSLSGELSVGPEVTYKSRIYTFAGPDIAMGAKAGIDGSVVVTGVDPMKIKASVAVFVGFNLDGSVKLTLLKWELINLNLFKIGVRVNLLQYEKELPEKTA